MNFLKISQVYAAEQLTNPVTGNMGLDAEGSLDGSLFVNFIIRLWQIAISLGALVVLLFYVLAAYEWLTSGSDSKGVENAKNRFINATIGLMILVSSFAIVGFVGNLLFGEDFNILSITFPTAD